MCKNIPTCFGQHIVPSSLGNGVLVGSFSPRFTYTTKETNLMMVYTIALLLLPMNKGMRMNHRGGSNILNLPDMSSDEESSLLWHTARRDTKLDLTRAYGVVQGATVGTLKRELLYCWHVYFGNWLRPTGLNRRHSCERHVSHLPPHLWLKSAFFTLQFHTGHFGAESEQIYHFGWPT